MADCTFLTRDGLMNANTPGNFNNGQTPKLVWEATPAPYYSMVVPMYNEEDSVQELYEGLGAQLWRHLGSLFEILFIDDGSKDKTYEKLTAIAAADSAGVLIIKLRRNFGQTPGPGGQGSTMPAARSSSPWMATCSTTPTNCPNSIAKIDEGGLMHGLRLEEPPGRRPDAAAVSPAICQLVNSKNLRRGVIHDFGTTFKAYQPRCHRAPEFVWRFAPLYPCPCGHGRRNDHLGADPQHQRLYRPSNYELLGRTFRVMLDLLHSSSSF